jgi:lysophospholipase L1-like esterase
MVTDPGRRVRIGVWLALSIAAGGVVVLLQACLGDPTPPPPPAPPPESRLLSPAALAPLFDTLAGVETRSVEHPVRILQLGDSHTANDSLSGRLRDRFQEHFGDAGRGWLPAGIPFKYYRPHGVTVSESGWRHIKPSDRQPGLAFGLDAIDAQSEPPDSVMAIESTDPAGFDRFAVEYLTQPHGSAFTVQIDDREPVRVSTAAALPAIARFDLPLDRAAHRVELHTAGRPPVDLLGWTVERRVPGVIYENHGTIGAAVNIFEQMTPEAVSYELGERRPALIIIAFGTNEGFADGLDLDRYAQRYRDAVAQLQRRAPQPAILVLGTPDGNRVAHGCEAARCGSGTDECTWQEPPKLTEVRDLQRRIAHDSGWAYWDWFRAMGGTCSIDRMTLQDPPLAAPDHIHLTKSGYEGIADMLFDDLMKAYGDWKAHGPSS